MRRAVRTWIAAGALAGASCGAGTRARADDGWTVRATGCLTLDEAAVARLLAIELGAQGARPGLSLRVTLECDGPRLHIVAIDPITARRLERDVDVGARPPDDHVVAILASQLLLSAWSDLLLDRPGGAAGDARAPAAAGGPPPDGTPAPALPPAAAPRWIVSATAGARVRDLPSPLALARLALRAGWALGRVRPFVELSGERGTVSRASGELGAWLAEAAVGASLRLVARQRVVFDVEALGSAAWVDVRGARPAAGVQVGSVSGVVAEVAAGLAPALRFGVVEVGLLLQIGAGLSHARARVANDHDLSLAGPWLGAGLALRLSGAGP